MVGICCIALFRHSSERTFPDVQGTHGASERAVGVPRYVSCCSVMRCSTADNAKRKSQFWAPHRGTHPPDRSFGACCLDVRDFNFLQTHGFSIKPLKVKRLAVEQISQPRIHSQECILGEYLVPI